MVRICKHPSAPSFVIRCYLGSDYFRDTWCSVGPLPKQENANDLMTQSAEAINCLSCPLYHVKEVFCCLLPPFVLGIKVDRKLNVGEFCIHWTTLPVLFYDLCFIIFTCLHILYLYF